MPPSEMFVPFKSGMGAVTYYGGAGAGVNGVEGATEDSKHSSARCETAIEDSEHGFAAYGSASEVSEHGFAACAGHSGASFMVSHGARGPPRSRNMVSEQRKTAAEVFGSGF